MEWIKEFVKKLDTPAAEALQVEIFRLQFADAIDLERILSELFERRQATPIQPQMPFQPPQQPGQQQQAAVQRRTAVPTEPEAIITADPRTNSIIVAATREKLEVIRNLIQQLDVDARPNLQFEIIPLQRAYAPDLAQILQTLLFEEHLRRSDGQGSNLLVLFNLAASSLKFRLGLFGSVKCELLPTPRQRPYRRRNQRQFGSHQAVGR